MGDHLVAVEVPVDPELIGTTLRAAEQLAVELPRRRFAAEMDDFAQCIVEKKRSKVAGEEGLRDVTIMMAIYESARTGRPVELRLS